MKRYYDSQFNRLIYIGKAATDQFWDDLWQTDDFHKAIKSTPNSSVAKITKKYLCANSRILEGGCGQANHVYALYRNGFDAVGLDYAENTVNKIKEFVPELQIEFGDVRKLPFKDNSFDGYWSRGVIEHFWNGYDSIANEMKRVIRPSGYLFLTFPCMSFLRIKKAQRGLYPRWENGTEPKDFYQFALNPSSVNKAFSSLGFQLVHESGLDPMKGIKDDFPYLNKSFSTLYNSQAFTSRVARKLINLLLLPNLFGHIRLMVLIKK